VSRSSSNPVVAAYGTAHELEFSGRVPTLEWDVFLDPYLVKRVEIVLHEKEAFIQRQKEARAKATKSKNERATDSRDDGDEDCSMEPAPSPTNYSSERLVLKYYDTEIRRRTSLLVDRMLIAHGNVVQLVLEQTGWLKKYNFSRVKRTRKTLGGGIFARQWLAVYSEAMKLGLGGDEFDLDNESIDSETMDSLATQDDTLDDDQSESSRKKDSSDNPAGPPTRIYMRRSTVGDEEKNTDDDDDDAMSTDGSIVGSTVSESSPQVKTDRTHPDKTNRRKRKPSRTSNNQREVDAVVTSLNQAAIVPDKSITESIQLLQQIMQCSAPFGLLLDMKSRHVSRRVWAVVVDFLRDCGVRVEGIGECLLHNQSVFIHFRCLFLSLLFPFKASFFVEEIRDISQYCRVGVNEIVFFHSAGDLQLSCNKGLVKIGDMLAVCSGITQISTMLLKSRTFCCIDCSHASMVS